MDKFQTSNGITVLYSEQKKLPVVSVNVFVNAGNIYENKKNYGITSLMMTLMTKGTKTRTAEQIATESENTGTVISASADKDFATLSFSAVKKHLPKMMELLADVLINPTFPEDEFQKEKMATLAAIHSRKDRIFTVADDLSNRTFFSEHPYSVPEIGTLKTINKIKRQDIINWHKNILTAQNILISIAGDLTIEEAKNLVEKYFITMAQGKKLEATRSEIKVKKRTITEKHDFKQAYLMISYPAPKVGQKDYATLKVFSAIVGGRMSARLFRELREKLSLAYEVNAFYPTQKQYGKFTFYIGLDEKNLEIAQQGLNRIIDDIKTNGVTSTELTETKNYLKGVYLMQRQTVERKSWYNGFWEVMGVGWQYDEKYLTDMLEVSTDDIKSAVNQYFNHLQEVIIKIIPKK